jgi:hypothetical protein
MTTIVAVGAVIAVVIAIAGSGSDRASPAVASRVLQAEFSVQDFARAAASSAALRGSSTVAAASPMSPGATRDVVALETAAREMPTATIGNETLRGIARSVAATMSPWWPDLAVRLRAAAN